MTNDLKEHGKCGQIVCKKRALEALLGLLIRIQTDDACRIIFLTVPMDDNK